MNFDQQKKTFSNFVKLTTYFSITIIAVLVLMAFFLL